MDSTKDKEESSKPEKPTDDSSQATNIKDGTADNRDEIAGDAKFTAEIPSRDDGSEQKSNE